jgi:tetratricopeptide (TPR) repeat protein
MMLGVLYDNKKQPDKANEQYQTILNIDKNFYPAANNLAWNYAEHGGNLDIALGLAQKAVETSNDPEIADTLGWILYKKGIYARALELFRENNEKTRSSNPVLLYHLGLAAYKEGDRTLARDSLTKALALNQSFPGAEDAKKVLAEVKPPPGK